MMSRTDLLILLDLKLPQVMGLDVLKWIREQPGEQRVVVIFSASAHETDVSSAYRLGANGYLVKPSESSKLQEMAKTICEYWLTLNTSPPSFSEPAPGKCSEPLAVERGVPGHWVTLSELKLKSTGAEILSRLGRNGEFMPVLEMSSF